MWKSIKKFWRYLGTLVGVKFEEAADPKIQLEQAIREARDDHRRLTEQAANVIANQKQTQLRLDRALEEYEKANASARQALLLADQESRAGDAEKAASFTSAAESYANRLLTLEGEVESLKKMLLDTTQAADQAKSMVAQNSAALQKKLAEREQLLSALDQAKMQEQMNTAMAQLTEAVGDDVPTFEEVRTKIDKRLAAAQGMAELTSANVDVHMLEVEKAQFDAQTQLKLSELRSELGLGAASEAAATATAEGSAPTASSESPGSGSPGGEVAGGEVKESPSGG